MRGRERDLSLYYTHTALHTLSAASLSHAPTFPNAGLWRPLVPRRCSVCTGRETRRRHGPTAAKHTPHRGGLRPRRRRARRKSNARLVVLVGAQPESRLRRSQRGERRRALAFIIQDIVLLQSFIVRVLLLPPSSCKAFLIAILLHDHCAIYAPPRTPPVCAIHHAILVVAISCEGQVARGGRSGARVGGGGSVAGAGAGGMWHEIVLWIG